MLAGTVLARLDQVLGKIADLRVSIDEPPVLVTRRAFAEPLISSEGVEAAAADLTMELCTLLDRCGRGGSRFTMSFYRTDGTCAHVQAGTSSPSRNAGHLMRLMSERIATIDAGYGIDVMVVSATSVEPLGARQIALDDRGLASAEADLACLIDRLSNRLGAPRVVRIAAADSHVPERAQIHRPALAMGGYEPGGVNPVLDSTCDAPADDVSSQGPCDSARPQFLLPVPEPIAVMAQVPEGPPLRFTWRRLARRVVRAQGPERIAPQWWGAIGRPPSAAIDHLRERTRDYYALEDTAGGRYWVFRAGLYGGEPGIEADCRVETTRQGGHGCPAGERDEGEADEMRIDDSRDTERPIWFMHGVFG